MFQMQIRSGNIALLAPFCLFAASQLSATVLTFEFGHGTVVNEQYAPLGVHISAINPNRSFDLATAFDTMESGTQDPDLESPFDGGNAQTEALGNVLIISESDDSGESVVPEPDDEGRRPAGELIFDFDQVQTIIGFHVLDVEEGQEVNGSSVEFYLNNVLVDSVPFADLPSMTPGIVFADNYANVVNPFGLQSGSGFDRVVFVMGGSGAIDNVVFGVPEPGLWGLMGLGGLLLFPRRRKSRLSSETSHSRIFKETTGTE